MDQGTQAEQQYDPPRLLTTQVVVAPLFSRPVADLRIRPSERQRLARDTEFGGNGRVYGTTEIKGTPNRPTKARVRLLRDRDSLLARETWSDPDTGAFDFPDIDTSQKFITLAADANGDFRPVAASRLTPEVPA